jgi:predicted cupin superfamily sugar epimerase
MIGHSDFVAANQPHELDTSLYGILERKRASSVHKDSIWRIYHSSAGRSRAIRFFIKNGYRYFVTWIDVLGFGLEADYRAAWQPKEGLCAVHID